MIIERLLTMVGGEEVFLNQYLYCGKCLDL